MFVGVNVSALLGDKVADLATINFDIGTASKGGEFNASSGVVLNGSTFLNFFIIISYLSLLSNVSSKFILI